jgi:hypothetical protein
MNTTAAAASVAAISGLAAYVNGKYHIAQDLRALRFRRQAASYYEELGTLKILIRDTGFLQQLWILDLNTDIE